MTTDSNSHSSVGSVPISDSSSPLARLRLMQLISPSLPIGAYAFSQGLEWAVESGAIKNKQQTSEWISAQLQLGQSHLDLPVIALVYQALSDDDIDEVIKLNDIALANRETQELWLEDSQLGLALKRVLKSLAFELPEQVTQQQDVSYCTLFAFACFHWQIALEDTLQGFAWAWLENQIAAATKLVPLGQTQAQQLMFELSDEIAAACVHAQTLTAQQLGMSLPGLAMMSARHETQYSRLFRS